MKESMPSSAQPAQEAQKPRTWFFVRGVFVDEGMKDNLRSEALYEAVAKRARIYLMKNSQHAYTRGGSYFAGATTYSSMY